MFFDDFPRFYETSKTSPSRGRLNLRYEAIFAENREVFAGARVLDIASHDGRWSLAALYCGAQSVVGIEARPDLVEHSQANLAYYDYDSDRATFIAGDVLDVLTNQRFDVDVVLCLGFLYHTLRFNELLSGIKRTNPRYLLLDTESEQMMHGGRGGSVVLRTESVQREGNAVSDDFSYGGSVLVGRPNLNAIRMMTKAYDFEVERLSDWGALLRDNPELSGVDDYAKQTRVTIRCRAVDRPSAE